MKVPLKISWKKESILYSMLSLLALSMADAFVLFTPDRRTFLPSTSCQTPKSTKHHYEQNKNNNMMNQVVEKYQSEYHYMNDPNLTEMEKIEIAEKAHSMPWKNPLPPISSDIDYDTEMFYTPFWEWGIQYLKENLTNVRVVECTSKGSRSFGNAKDEDEDDHTSSSTTTAFDYQENEYSRIVSLCFTSDEYRKIRFTYYENSKRQQQSFGSVWYPNYTYNLPILGLNLLSNQERNTNLAMMDFQPLHFDQDADHVVPYSDIQKDILHNHQSEYTFVSDRIPTLQVFSDHIMCKKFEEQDVVSSHIFPAYCDFIKEHIALVKSSPQTPELQQFIRGRHAQYDTYSAVRDPCSGLLTASFGKEWADEFVFGFLYSMAGREMQDYWTTTTTKNGDDDTGSNQQQKTQNTGIVDKNLEQHQEVAHSSPQ